MLHWDAYDTENVNCKFEKHVSGTFNEIPSFHGSLIPYAVDLKQIYLTDYLNRQVGNDNFVDVLEKIYGKGAPAIKEWNDLQVGRLSFKLERLLALRATSWGSAIKHASQSAGGAET